VDPWLGQARDEVARAAGVAPESLELARVAAHESGERTNAPLLCYLVGRAQNGASLLDLVEAVRRSTY
jgi:hypothetical protein